MYPELFTIPGLNLPIRGFGVALVVGLMLGILLAKRLARSRGIDGEVFVSAGVLAMVTGVIGSRLSHVIENLPTYTDPERSVWSNLVAAVNISSGGLTYYGGFILAFVVVSIYAIRKRIPLRTGADIVAPCVMVGLAFGRIGCFLNGCCYGAPADVPWAIRFPYASIPYMHHEEKGLVDVPMQLTVVDPERPGKRFLMDPEMAARNPLTRDIAAQSCSLPVHPAQLYSSLTALLLAAVCTAYFTLPHAPGRVMALMLMLEGTARFLLESVRDEPSLVRYTLGGQAFGLSYSMVIGLLIIGVGMLLWLVLGHFADRPEAGSATLAPLATATP